ncbi:STAS domain-containing protein [Methylobacterium oryzisoli]|uniref:STAS domain-containing protein n=1 Tax=Methylobacterium oryzisoli TaxID=3385502 RepID=UPI003892A7DB
MPLDLSSDRIALSGLCTIEEAEPLLAALRDTADPVVDIAGLERAHTAILQVLMACRPVLSGAPRDPVAAACLAGLDREGHG